MRILEIILPVLVMLVLGMACRKLKLLTKSGIDNMIKIGMKEDKILYIDNKKSHNLFSFARVQFPRALNKYDFDTIIHKSRNIVNNNAN